MKKIDIEDLVEHAKQEENQYKWEKAAILYELAVDCLIDKNYIDKLKEIFYNCVFSYYRASDSTDN